MARAEIFAAEQAASEIVGDSGRGFGRRESTPGELAALPATIAEVAQEFGVTLRTLRFYEARGLIAPQRRGATRLYYPIDRDRIGLILTGRRLGFTLAEIAGLLARPGGRNLHLNREKCVEQINHLERQKREIERAIAELRQIYSSFYNPLAEGRDRRTR